MTNRRERPKTVKGVNKLLKLLLLLLVLNLYVPTMVTQAANTGTVTANVLNIRTRPSTSSTIRGRIAKGTRVNIVSQTRDSQGGLWYKIQAPVNGRSVTGYVSAVYIRKTSSGSSNGNTYARRFGRIRSERANIRQSTTVKSKSLGRLKKSTLVKVTNVKTKGKWKWYYVTKKVNGKTVSGYIRSDLVKLYPTQVSSSRYQLGQSKVRGRVYKTANSHDSYYGTISPNQPLIIRGQVKVHKTNWTKVTVRLNGKNVTGYFLSNRISTLRDKNNAHPSVGYMKNKVTVRRLATSFSTKRDVLNKNKKVTIIGRVDINGTRWFKCQYKVSGKNRTGYIPANQIKRYLTTAKATKYQLGVANENVNLYKNANTSDQRLGRISKNQQVIIRSDFKIFTTNWTQVIARINGKNVTGYVMSNRIKQVPAKAKTTTSQLGTTNRQITARRIASNVSSSRGNLSNGTKVTVLGNVTVNGTRWYKCQYSVSGKTQTGYIAASNITLDTTTAFENSIAGFPNSYKPALRKLHQTYPNWKFVPVNTGLNWDTVIANQTRVGRNTISSTAPSNGASGTYSAPFSYLSTASGAYDWATDTYKLCDGTTWYTASEDVIKYYMDPRNALTSTQIFQFESLAYDSAQKKGVVTSILKGTFMNGTYSYRVGGTNYTRYYNSSFMTAGKQAGVSPYFLAARARQELGTTKSGSVTGTYPGYEGYYNYFNIGANDSAGGGAIANGLRFAKSGTTYLRPWNTPYKSIRGGALYIGNSYIAKGQNTLYFQKFSVVNSAYLYWHQYMTNVQAPTSEGRTTYNAYNSYGILKGNMVFYIPVYNNMPSSACALPAKTGNPNSYLKSLVVKNGSKSLSFNRTFSYNTTSYNMVVASGVNSISVSASPVSKFAQGVSGTGSYNISSLAAGKSRTIKVTCTAGNGTKKTYSIKITRASN